MPVSTRTAATRSILAACGLAAAMANAQDRPFPGVLELADLDPVLGITLDGQSTGDNSGFALAGIGDFNGDGLDDLAIGAPRVAPPGGGQARGSVYVVFGRAGGLAANLDLSDLNGTNGVRIDGTAAFDFFGVSVAGAGDVNGDGIADLLVGAYAASRPDRSLAGAAFLVFGRDASSGAAFPAVLSAADLDGATGVRLSGASPSDFTGKSVAAAGDANGDGIGDVIIGAPKANPQGRDSAGATYVVFGRDASGGPAFAPEIDLAALDGLDGFRIDGAARLDRAGIAVAGGGDLNGDGRADLAVAADGADPDGRDQGGSTYVLFGRPGGVFPAVIDLADIEPDAHFRIDGGGTGIFRSGSDVAFVGDINDDGLDDLAVTSTDPGMFENTVDAFVVFGRAAGSPFPPTLRLRVLDGADGFRLTGPVFERFSTAVVSAAGDINGDGLDDLAIGVGYAEPDGRTQAGSTFIVYGRDDGRLPAAIDLTRLDGGNGFRINGARTGDRSGGSVAAAGDINGDGRDDLAIGAPRAMPMDRLAAGQTTLLFGRQACPADLDGDGALTIFDFLTFGNLFDDRDPRADFDGDGDFTVFDFLAFQNAFDAGCP